MSVKQPVIACKPSRFTDSYGVHSFSACHQVTEGVLSSLEVLQQFSVLELCPALPLAHLLPAALQSGGPATINTELIFLFLHQTVIPTSTE